ncbi:MAG TPA: hypothetical protein VMA72_17675 [Streptosporangiaceae bacterium]|nr:hypothetical protein [Streptosporangiaceae bacterium]
MSGNLEWRYRRVLRLLPDWYRERWEEDMVAAFLDSWLTGDPEADAYISKAAGPSSAEIASVASLAARLYLGGAGALLRRNFGWSQATRRAVLAVMLVNAVRGLDGLVVTAWSRHLLGWLPASPASMASSSPGPWAPVVWYLVDYALIVVFVLLVLRYYRTAQVLAAVAIVPDLARLLYGEFIGAFQGPSLGPWAFWVLLFLVPVLAMTAFHRNAPPAPRWPWLLALPANYLLVAVPLLAVQATGNSAWLPDFSGLYCLLVSLACVAHAPRARSQSAGSGVWSLTLALLAADAGAYRIFSIADYLHDPHLITVSLAELLILVAAVALVVPDAARAATPEPPPHPHTMASQ